MVVLTKTDLGPCRRVSAPEGVPAVYIISLTGDGLDELSDLIEKMFPLPDVPAGEILTNSRQADAVGRALASMRAALDAMDSGATPDIVLTETEEAMDALAQITGQKASIRTARRSIAGFKVREGAKIGCMTTLRGERMYEFLDRLLNVAIPRVRDFRGVSPKSFDQQGNYTIGLREQTIFPEIKIDDVSRVRGMNITFVIKNSGSADASRALLRRFGMPFRS